jgi:hypothetical protein
VKNNNRMQSERAMSVKQVSVTFGKIEIHEYKQQEYADLDFGAYETATFADGTTTTSPTYPRDDGMEEWMVRKTESSSRSSLSSGMSKGRSNKGTSAGSSIAKSWLSSMVRSIKHRSSRGTQGRSLKKHGKITDGTTIIP